MTKSERQLLLDEIARRDEVIARQAAEILVLRQTIDALSRRVFGVSSEKLDPAQLQLMLGLGEIAPVPAVPENPGAAPETAQPDHRKKKPGKQPRAPRIPEHLPLVREILDPPEVLLNPDDYRRIGEEVREQLHFKPAEFILLQIGHLYHIEAKLRESKAGPALREAVRASQSRMIHRRLKKLFGKLSIRRSILPKSKLGQAVSYALNQWPNLEVYLGDGRVEIDNNLVENAIRPTKLGAKNWLFIGNEHSGRKTAILYTIVENCRRLGINTKEYLEDVLTRLPAMKASEAVSLTPANWLKARRGKALRKIA